MRLDDPPKFWIGMEAVAIIPDGGIPGYFDGGFTAIAKVVAIVKDQTDRRPGWKYILENSIGRPFGIPEDFIFIHTAPGTADIPRMT